MPERTHNHLQMPAKRRHQGEKRKGKGQQLPRPSSNEGARIDGGAKHSPGLHRLLKRIVYLLDMVS